MLSQTDASQNRGLDDEDRLVINEAQLVLAEKRTSLAALRTGIAVVALPLTVVSFLIAASHYYEVEEVSGLLVPLLAICLGLTVLGSWLVARSMLKLRREERLLNHLKRHNSIIAKFMD